MKNRLRTIQLIVNNKCNCFCKMCDVGVLRRSLKSENEPQTRSNFVRNIYDQKESSSLLSIDEYCKSYTPGKAGGLKGSEPLKAVYDRSRLKAAIHQPIGADPAVGQPVLVS